MRFNTIVILLLTLASLMFNAGLILASWTQRVLPLAVIVLFGGAIIVWALYCLQTGFPVLGFD